MNALFGLGRQNIGNKAVAFNADTFKATLLTMSSAAGKIALIASSTNATPIVLTTGAAHGAVTGDIVVVGGHATNTAANGTWQVGTTTATTMQLLTRIDAGNSTGNGVGGATGWVLNLSQGSVLTDVSGNSSGTDATLTGVTNTLGVINASSFSWTNPPATKVWGCAIYDSTATNDLIAWFDGTLQIYVVTQAAVSATSIAVQRLSAAIANGTTIVFSDGASATLTAQANVGDTSLTVSALAAIVHRQATADVATLSAGFPVTPTGNQNFTFTPDTGPSKLLAL